MKRLRSSLLAKIIACLLLFVFLVIAVVSGIASWVLAENGVYYGNNYSIMNDLGRGICGLKADGISDFFVEVINERVTEYQVKLFTETYLPSNSNLRYCLRNDKGEVLYTNYNQEKVWVSIEGYRIRSDASLGYLNTVTEVFENEDDANKYVSSFYDDHRTMVESVEVQGVNGEYKATVKYRSIMGEFYYLDVFLPEEFTARDWIYYAVSIAKWVVFNPYVVIGILVFSCVISVISLAFLCLASGYRKGYDDIHLGLFAAIPVDIWVVLIICALSVLYEIFEPFHYGSEAIVFAAFAIIVGVGSLVSFSARVKVKGWWKNSLVYYVLRLLFKSLLCLLKGIRKAIVNISLFWKTALVCLAITLAEMVFLAFGISEYLVLWVILKLILIPVLIKFIFDLRALEKSGGEIASGNISYKTDERKLLPSLRRHASDLNGISSGLEKALDTTMKSERMKSELITKVLIDIKTPLTSIINYVDLLKRDGLDSENASEYLSVIDRQSARLKKLTEDLVEASKASSGAIHVNYDKNDANIILQQAMGEYQEKLARHCLEPVVAFPDGESYIYADGRLLWRVFDNLLVNICKYSMPHTRVYISLERTLGVVRVTFRNISAEQLNISSDELTERFVRGDSSRNTDGSGLGLSIAKSLTELQGGRFDINIDGDLFKATVEFDEYNK